MSILRWKLNSVRLPVSRIASAKSIITMNRNPTQLVPLSAIAERLGVSTDIAEQLIANGLTALAAMGAASSHQPGGTCGSPNNSVNLPSAKLDDAKYLTLAQAARLLPTKPAPSTLWRWARKGVRGVHLEYRRLGGKIVVTEQGIRCFMDELTRQDAEGAEPASRPAEPLEPASRRMSKGELETELKREGLW